MRVGPSRSKELDECQRIDAFELCWIYFCLRNICRTKELAKNELNPQYWQQNQRKIYIYFTNLRSIFLSFFLNFKSSIVPLIFTFITYYFAKKKKHLFFSSSANFVYIYFIIFWPFFFFFVSKLNIYFYNFLTVFFFFFSFSSFL